MNQMYPVAIRPIHLLPSVAITASLLFLAFRMTIGVGFSDEAYYAAFVDGWLKTGIGASQDLMAHQTAALWVYPVVLAYRALSGGVDGLMLVLRFVYLAAAAVASLCLFRAVLAYRGPVAATVAAVFTLWFIPFGLPAPSYNTLGMWFVLAALALFTMPFSHSRADLPTRLPNSLRLSAACWVVAVVAYPPMAVSGIVLALLAPCVLRQAAERRLILRYAALCASLGVAAAVIVCAVLRPAHVLQMLSFTNSLNNVSGGMERKLHMALTLFTGNPRFAIACVTAIVVAVVGLLARPATALRGAADAAIALLIIVVITAPAPTLFVYSHDLVILLALAGSGAALRSCVARDADGASRVFGLVYAVALCAGAVTMTTAYNGLFNFPVGGFGAACLAVALWMPRASATPGGTRGRLAAAGGVAAALTACAAMVWTAFASYYGEWNFSYAASVPMPRGVYAGLRSTDAKAEYAAQMTRALTSLAACGDTVAVLRGEAGNYLLAPMRPETVSTWGTVPGAGQLALDTISAHYRTHRPDIIIVDDRPEGWLPPLSDAAKALLANYVLARQVVAGSYHSSIYRRPGCHAG